MSRPHVAALASTDTGDSPKGWQVPLRQDCGGWHSPEYVLMRTGLILPNQFLDQQTRIEDLLQAQPCTRTPMIDCSPPLHLRKSTVRLRKKLSTQDSHPGLPSQGKEVREDRDLGREPRNQNRLLGGRD